MPTSGKRPAHRPSRRGVVVSAAMQLFAVRPIDEVTVADIADEAGMTPAAVYYHYASKDDLLLDGLRLFAADLVAAVAAAVGPLGRGDDIGEAITDVLEWASERRYPATVWFVTSPGLSISVESLRRETRSELVAVFASAVRAVRPGTSVVEASASAAGLLALLEQSMASWLTEDTVLAQLGRRRFCGEVSALAGAISGT
jgi:AcrR family transcriptional regulator